MNCKQIADLKAALNYDPDTGVLTWKTALKNQIRPGLPADSSNGDGYLRVCFNGKKLYAHRAAWAIHYGVWPDGLIDHIDGDKSNNRIRNLRVVNRRENAQNRTRASRHSKTGLLGVRSPSGRSRRFEAVIRFDGKQRSLGYFATAQEAHEAYLSAKSEKHPGYLR